MVSRLIAGYPSHGFVIDFNEAETIFPSVRFVNQIEASLERKLIHLVRNENDEPTISDLVEITKETPEVPEMPFADENLNMDENSNKEAKESSEIENKTDIIENISPSNEKVSKGESNNEKTNGIPKPVKR